LSWQQHLNFSNKTYPLPKPLKKTFQKSVRSMNRIKDVLKIQGRTQIWLAKQINRSYVVTTNYCNNKTQPNVAVLVKMAEALDVDVRDLLSPTKS
jgi:transcriptional regulator with XRE-family HTH domain